MVVSLAVARIWKCAEKYRFTGFVNCSKKWQFLSAIGLVQTKLIESPDNASDRTGTKSIELIPYQHCDSLQAETPDYQPPKSWPTHKLGN